MRSLTTKYGAWAVVTGASSGIGRSFADQLAQAGMNIVLVARSENALRKTADGLQARYTIQTRVLALDLTAPVARETLDLETLDLDIGLLVNNAAAEQCGSFVRHSARELQDTIELNVTAPTELAQRFGERFVGQRRGAMIFVSGSIGYQGVPHLANYAATKAHQLHLAEALHYELRPHGVDVLGLAPGLTKTPMAGRLGQAIRFSRVGMMQLSPHRVAQVGLQQLGRRPSVVVGLQYRFFAILTKRLLSRASGAWLFGTLMRIAFVDKALLDSRSRPTVRTLNSANPRGQDRFARAAKKCVFGGDREPKSKPVPTVGRAQINPVI